MIESRPHIPVVVASDSVRARRRFMARLSPSLVAQVAAIDESHLFGDGLEQRDVMVETLLRAGNASDPARSWANSTSPTWAAFESFVADLHALSSCDAMVGKFTSNLARLVLELISARLGRVAPYISLDAAWCFGGHEPSPHGRSFFAC